MSAGSTPDCSAALLRCSEVPAAVLAASAAVPGALWAGAPPASAGVVPPSPPPAGGVAGGGAGAGVSVRSPVAIFVKRMPVPSAAASSCTIRLGMSTCAGMALPSRTISP